jgi:Beta-galactosidase
VTISGPPRGAGRRAGLVSALLVGLCLLGACGVSMPGGGARAPASTPSSSTGCSAGRERTEGTRFGVLQSSGDFLREQARAGITLLTLELAWDRYEPQRGRFDASYVAEQRAKLESFCRAGFDVVLGAGLNHAPNWVFALDADAYYVNQYGDRFTPPEREDRVPNAVFDPAVRQAQAQYLARVRADFCDCFYAIRVGAGQDGEVIYPSAVFKGHGNSFWVYDRRAQADSPVPGWRPGQPGQTEARQFWDYYIGRLVAYQNWLIGVYRSHFSSWLEPLYPGWGLRPGQADAAVAGLLSGDTQAEREGLTNVGTDFGALVRGLTDSHVIVYSTAMEKQDRSSTPAGTSPIHHLQDLASARGLPAGGENSGIGQSADVMRVCVGKARSMSLATMMWLAEPELAPPNPPAASLDDYGRLIHSTEGHSP